MVLTIFLNYREILFGLPQKTRRGTILSTTDNTNRPTNHQTLHWSGLVLSDVEILDLVVVLLMRSNVLIVDYVIDYIIDYIIDHIIDYAIGYIIDYTIDYGTSTQP